MFTLTSRLGLACFIASSAILSTAVPTAAIAGDQASSAAAEMKMMDADRDGKVSAAEHATGARRMFVMMDADRDGNVTAVEMDAAHAKMPAHDAGGKDRKQEMSSAQKIKVIDSDGDGALSAAEHAAGSEKMFAKMDVDHDGSLTAAEIQAGHEALMSARGQ